MEFKRVGPRAVASHYRAPAHVCGFGTVVHGGIQATLLDDVMAMAAKTPFDDPHVQMVTAELSVRYRQPVHVEMPLVIHAELVRTEGRNYFIEGEIRDAGGVVLTTAQARWCLLESPHHDGHIGIGKS